MVQYFEGKPAYKHVVEVFTDEISAMHKALKLMGIFPDRVYDVEPHLIFHNYWNLYYWDKNPS